MRSIIFYILICLLTLYSCKQDDNPIEIEVYTSDFITTIDENPDEGQVLGTIEGTTNQGKVSFSITSETLEGGLAVDSDTGELSITNTALFDYELVPSITAIITVANGDANEIANVTINLNDVEESASFTEITPNGIDLSNMTALQAVVFNEKLWLIGGYDNSNRINTIWSSSDGINWSEETVIGMHFSERMLHQVLVFDNKIWVIGGDIDSGDENDVWSSPDGVNWTQEVIIGSHFAPRLGHQALVFNDKIWVIGGSINNFAMLGNDVWSSSDGTLWIESVMAGARFSPRWLHQAIVFNDKIWVIAGNETGKTNDIWSSSNGTHWDQEFPVGPYFSERSFHQVTTFNNKLWLIGGRDLTNTMQNDIWYSPNGIHWVNETVEGAYFGTIIHHEMIVFQDKLWVIGGNNEFDYHGIWRLDLAQ